MKMTLDMTLEMWGIVFVGLVCLATLTLVSIMFASKSSDASSKDMSAKSQIAQLSTPRRLGWSPLPTSCKDGEIAVGDGLGNFTILPASSFQILDSGESAIVQPLTTPRSCPCAASLLPPGFTSMPTDNLRGLCMQFATNTLFIQLVNNVYTLQRITPAGPAPCASAAACGCTILCLGAESFVNR